MLANRKSLSFVHCWFSQVPTTKQATHIARTFAIYVSNSEDGKFYWRCNKEVKCCLPKEILPLFLTNKGKKSSKILAKSWQSVDAFFGQYWAEVDAEKEFGMRNTRIISLL